MAGWHGERGVQAVESEARLARGRIPSARSGRSSPSTPGVLDVAGRALALDGSVDALLLLDALGDGLVAVEAPGGGDLAARLVAVLALVEPLELRVGPSRAGPGETRSPPRRGDGERTRTRRERGRRRAARPARALSSPPARTRSTPRRNVEGRDREHDVDERLVQHVPEVEELLRRPSSAIRRCSASRSATSATVSVASAAPAPAARRRAPVGGIAASPTGLRRAGRAGSAAELAGPATAFEARELNRRESGGGQRLPDLGDARLQFRGGELHAAQRLGDAHVEVAPDEAREDDDDHRPVRDRDQAVELQGRVERDQGGPDDPAEDVDLEPDLEAADLGRGASFGSRR